MTITTITIVEKQAPIAGSQENPIRIPINGAVSFSLVHGICWNDAIGAR